MRARVLALGLITLTSLVLCVYVLSSAQRTAAAVPAFPRLHPEATPPPTGNQLVPSHRAMLCVPGVPPATSNRPPAISSS